ncbi:MAG: hypothetical protein CMH46_00100 [Muricauda sp.]|nr:hypothetical protein [Allomuricauda sp.]MAU13923.1 hypothetical protein [Allomuricauda sp.]
MNDLLIKHAKYNGQWYTPLQFCKKFELQNKTKKKNTLKLKCADGCDLIFKHTCKYYTQQGTQVVRQAHFAHKSVSRRDACLAMRKYSGGGGESYTHYRTKMNIAEQKNLKLIRQCADSDCNKKKRKYIPGNCYTAIEHRVNNRWLVDVAFFDKTTHLLKMVIEVKHKHGVDGEKRKWLIDQDFLYVEVGCNTESNTHLIIDSECVYYCTVTEGEIQYECELGRATREREQEKEEEEEYRREKWLQNQRIENQKRRMEEVIRVQELLKEKQRQREERETKWKKRMAKRRFLHNKATVLESACRAYLAKCKVQCLRKKTKAAVRIQSIWRCYKACETVKKIKKHRREMAIQQRQEEERHKRYLEILKEQVAERRRIQLIKDAEDRKKRREKRFREEIYASQQRKQAQQEEEKLAEIKRKRQRMKQREKRQDRKQIELQKKTVSYQKMINQNRQAFGLKKRKLQSNIACFFKKK